MVGTCRSDRIRDLNPKIIAWCFPAVILSALVSWRFLDTWIALRVMELLKFSSLSLSSIVDIPDALFQIVFIGSGLLWIIYLILRRRGIDNQLSRFTQLAGSVLPLTYLLKWFFKYVFGRINTRVWLANQVSDEFHWFHGGGDYSGFPSGHMAVFSAFFAAAWFFYPRCRSISIGILLILAVALVATNYHFLSDVIAGAYLGLIVTCLTRICIRKIWR
jgi:membrane-associated phospholipid phosphatase